MRLCSEGIPLNTGRSFRVPGTYSMNISNLFVGINDEKFVAKTIRYWKSFLSFNSIK